MQIEFTYRTPGLIPGLAVTVFSVLLLAAYLALCQTPPPPDPALANPGLLRRGSFSDYAKARRATFLHPGAMIPGSFFPDARGTGVRRAGAAGSARLTGTARERA